MIIITSLLLSSAGVGYAGQDSPETPAGAGTCDAASQADTREEKAMPEIDGTVVVDKT